MAYHVAVVALSGASYPPSQVFDKVWDRPSQVLDEDLTGRRVQWRELDGTAIEGTALDGLVQEAVMQGSIELRGLAKSLVPAEMSQVVMIRGASAAVAGVAAVCLAGLFVTHGAVAEAFFLDYVQDWGAELAAAIDLVRPRPYRAAALELP